MAGRHLAQRTRERWELCVRRESAGSGLQRPGPVGTESATEVKGEGSEGKQEAGLKDYTGSTETFLFPLHQEWGMTVYFIANRE